MSEEILKALMELFALIVKQDGGMILDEREYVSGLSTVAFCIKSRTVFFSAIAASGLYMIKMSAPA